MKLSLVVFVALGLTMAWQASVVADNESHYESAPQLTAKSTNAVTHIRDHRG